MKIPLALIIISALFIGPVSAAADFGNTYYGFACYSANCSDSSITTAASSSGSGGGSGAASTFDKEWKTYDYSDTDISKKNAFNQSLKEFERVKIFFEGKDYYLGVESYSSSVSSWLISSPDRLIILRTGTELRIDLDNDGIADIIIRLRGINDNGLDVLFSYIGIPGKLLDLTLNLEDLLIFTPNDPVSIVTMQNFGTANNFTVDITYHIIDNSSNEVYISQDTVLLYSDRAIKKRLQARLVPGNYTLVADIYYNDINERLKQTFEVREGDFFDYAYAMRYMMITVMLSIMTGYFIVIMKRRTHNNYFMHHRRGYPKEQVIQLPQGKDL